MGSVDNLLPLTKMDPPIIPIKENQRKEPPSFLNIFRSTKRKQIDAVVANSLKDAHLTDHRFLHGK